MFGLLTHKHDWQVIDIVCGQWKKAENRAAFVATAPCYHFWRCSCGRFAIAGLPDRSRLEGELPAQVAELSDFQVARYLLRHIPKRDRPRPMPFPLEFARRVAEVRTNQS